MIYMTRKHDKQPAFNLLLSKESIAILLYLRGREKDYGEIIDKTLVWDDALRKNALEVLKDIGLITQKNGMFSITGYGLLFINRMIAINEGKI